jgi:tetratricopeptide (TPR) repeat protein
MDPDDQSSDPETEPTPDEAPTPSPPEPDQPVDPLAGEPADSPEPPPADALASEPADSPFAPSAPAPEPAPADALASEPADSPFAPSEPAPEPAPDDALASEPADSPFAPPAPVPADTLASEPADSPFAPPASVPAAALVGEPADSPFAPPAPVPAAALVDEPADSPFAAPADALASEPADSPFAAPQAPSEPEADPAAEPTERGDSERVKRAGARLARKAQRRKGSVSDRWRASSSGSMAAYRKPDEASGGGAGLKLVGALVVLVAVGAAVGAVLWDRSRRGAEVVDAGGEAPPPDAKTATDEPPADPPAPPPPPRTLSELERDLDEALGDLDYVPDNPRLRAAELQRLRGVLSDLRADERLVEARLQDLAAAWSRLEALETKAAQPERPVDTTPTATVARGTPERREQMAARRALATARLEAAREALATRRRVEAKRWVTERERVQRLSAKSADGPGRVVAYDDDGFTLEGSTGQVAYRWSSCPAKLGFEVLRRAIDPDDAHALRRLGLHALRRGLFEEARGILARAGRKAPELADGAPDVRRIARECSLFRGGFQLEPVGDDEALAWPCVVSYAFDDAAEGLDFEGVIPELERAVVRRGALEVSALPVYDELLVNVRGAWRQAARIEATLPAPGRTAPALGIGVGARTLLVSFAADRVWISDLGPEPLAEAAVTIGARARVALSVEETGEELLLTVWLDGRVCLAHAIPNPELSFQFLLGAQAQGGRVRYEELRLQGWLDRAWREQIEAEVPGRIAEALEALEREGGDGLPVAYRETSAEDEVALQGIPQASLDLVAEARELIGRERWGQAEERLKEACRRSANYHAAQYLLARCWVDGDPDTALHWVGLALDGVEEFHEAWACRAEALVWVGRERQAEEAALRSQELGPDHAPAHLALALVRTAQGRYAEARDLLEVARELAPDDAEVERTLRRVRALVDGPAWEERARVESEHYVLDTDYADEARRLSNHLEAIRARLEEVFPILVSDREEARRRASVLVFRAPRGYYAYSDQTGAGRQEHTLGHFNPLTGQLLMFLEGEARESSDLHVLYHEATHQWMHAHAVGLPSWASEGIAEYVGGTTLGDDGRILGRAVIDPFLVVRLEDLTGRWDRRLNLLDAASLTPGEFSVRDGSLRYAQAWSMVHFFLEGGDPALRQAFLDYLARYRFKPRHELSVETARLQYAWQATFGELPDYDLASLQERWEVHVEGLAAQAGLEWARPEPEPEPVPFEDLADQPPLEELLGQVLAAAETSGALTRVLGTRHFLQDSTEGELLVTLTVERVEPDPPEGAEAPDGEAPAARLRCSTGLQWSGGQGGYQLVYEVDQAGRLHLAGSSMNLGGEDSGFQVTGTRAGETTLQMSINLRTAGAAEGWEDQQRWSTDTLGWDVVLLLLGPLADQGLPEHVTGRAFRGILGMDQGTWPLELRWSRADPTGPLRVEAALSGEEPTVLEVDPEAGLTGITQGEPWRPLTAEEAEVWREAAEAGDAGDDDGEGD